MVEICNLAKSALIASHKESSSKITWNMLLTKSITFSSLSTISTASNAPFSWRVLFTAFLIWLAWKTALLAVSAFCTRDNARTNWRLWAGEEFDCVPGLYG